MKAVLRTDKLTRRFGARTAVDALDLEVHEGDIYGLLGVNGAGKTTTIRMCLGLIRPSSGGVELFGLDARRNFIEVMGRIGALVELPAYYPHLTAADNLEIIRLLTPGTPSSRIPDVLEEVGLSARGRDAVRTLSQGMRQRLAIAMAILHRPKLAVLDEPTNGLDPAGIRQIRDLLRRLNREHGMTIIVSSHLLHEIEITCNRVAILSRGRLVVQERVSTLLAETAGLVRIEASPAGKAREVLQGLGWVDGVSVAEDGSLRVAVPPERHAELNAELNKAGLGVAAFAPERMTLEDYFLKHDDDRANREDAAR